MLNIVGRFGGGCKSPKVRAVNLKSYRIIGNDSEFCGCKKEIQTIVILPGADGEPITVLWQDLLRQ